MAAKAKTKKATSKSTKTTATTKKTTKRAAPPRKAAAKKSATTKTTTKKVATTKKSTPKKATTKKAAASPTSKTAETKKASTKTASAKDVASSPETKTETKKAKTKAASESKTTKTKRATKATKAATKSASAATEAEAKATPRKINVGQAPRKTTPTASIPTPTALALDEANADTLEAPKNAEASSAAKQDFKVNDKIVYPAHGVGEIVGLEKQQVAGLTIELFVIVFDQEKMKLRVPTGKAKAAGMRPLSDDKTVKDAIGILQGRARIKRTMWSRRAQEYDAKINSGDIKLVAEVVRDLYRADDQPEQSYSERQLFEAALDRMAREVAAVRKGDLGAAIEELEAGLKKKAAVVAAT